MSALSPSSLQDVAEHKMDVLACTGLILADHESQQGMSLLSTSRFAQDGLSEVLSANQDLIHSGRPLFNKPDGDAVVFIDAVAATSDFAETKLKV